MLEIRKAIKYYNEHREEGTDKMTSSSLAVSVLSDEKESTAKNYLSKWSNGYGLGTLKLIYLRRICEYTGVDANFIYNVSPMVNKDEN